MKDRRSLDAVDAALDAARRGAAGAKLPSALRARILAATRPAATPSRGRLVDFVLRGAAVAAACAAVLLVAPVSLQAAEIDVHPLGGWNDEIARHLPALDVALPTPSSIPAGAVWPLAVAAVGLLGAGLVAARSGGRR